MSLRFQEEPLAEAISEIATLVPEHSAEVAKDLDAASGIIMKPNWGSMLSLANIGLFRCFTIRDDEGTLVGYANFMLFPDMHRTLADGSPLLSSQDDAHFIAKRARGPGVALRFFAFVEEALCALGVRKLSIHTKPHLGHERFFSAMGFTLNDVIFTKYLSDLPEDVVQAEPEVETEKAA